jgi:hypothetical protein
MDQHAPTTKFRAQNTQWGFMGLMAPFTIEYELSLVLIICLLIDFRLIDDFVLLLLLSALIGGAYLDFLPLIPGRFF